MLACSIPNKVNKTDHQTSRMPPASIVTFIGDNSSKCTGRAKPLVGILHLLRICFDTTVEDADHSAHMLVSCIVIKWMRPTHVSCVPSVVQ